jgi:hypothetical protein
MSEPPDEPRLEQCTAVLMTVPFAVARRLESFLGANGVACRIRRTTLTAEQLAEEALRSASPDAARLLDSGIGRLFAGRLRRELKAEIQIHASGLTEQCDVLVRPSDLPADAAVAPVAGGASGGEADSGRDPWARPGEPTAVATTGSGTEADPGRVADAGPAAAGSGAVELCQLPWNQAWALVERLGAAGIAAAVLAPETTARDVPMADRVVPVGVQAGDLERARGFLPG